MPTPTIASRWPLPFVHLSFVITLSGLLGCQNEPGSATEVEIGASGGSVAVDGVSLRVPAGALDSPTVVTMRRLSDAQVEELADGAEEFGELVSAVVELTPHGLAFAKPAILELPYDDDGAGEPTTLERIEGEDGWSPVDAEFGDGVATVELEHFSWYQVRVDEDGDENNGDGPGDNNGDGPGGTSGGGGGGPVEFACETGTTVDIGCRDTSLGCALGTNDPPRNVVEIIEVDGDYLMRYNADGPGCRRVLGVVRRSSDDETPAEWSTFELRHISVYIRLGPVRVTVPGRVVPATQRYEVVWATYTRDVECSGSAVVGCKRAGMCDVAVPPQPDQTVFMLDLPWVDMGTTRKQAVVVNATENCAVDASIRETRPGSNPPEPPYDYTWRIDAGWPFAGLGELEIPSSTSSPPTRFGYELLSAKLVP